MVTPRILSPFTPSPHSEQMKAEERRILGFPDQRVVGFRRWRLSSDFQSPGVPESIPVLNRTTKRNRASPSSPGSVAVRNLTLCCNEKRSRWHRVNATRPRASSSFSDATLGMVPNSFRLGHPEAQSRACRVLNETNRTRAHHFKRLLHDLAA